MKKVIAILAMVTLAACVNPASTKTPVVDSAAAKVDSVKVEEVPAADSTSPILEVK
jgi:hypothetical protein